ncbi:RNP domain-containing protein [Ordospora colligata]|uniref:RNP domain-containing protein n=1 Tax=Ordospora colligata OC4 TaxID=1354746 RepID=A0A0B2UIM7_9MICR|nr:RNP domain-containing protein [Ordospora colligata OC4]KHN68815.1 RNP domain-containing protein [Ordospora colligata OC4]TBU13849.1 RNP domain-containing protein [Ordospora colligata]TBU14038.1 RNP domain-containing protein [Ordospora colligata]TBU17707.1 RNP domain-containing protein [Ordospora colligata]
MMFVTGIPESLDDDLFKEMLSVFGEVKIFERGCDLSGNPSTWAFVSYYESTSAESMHSTLSGICIGQNKISVYPELNECIENANECMIRKINAVIAKYKDGVENTDILNKFLSSYRLIYGQASNSNRFDEALQKWLHEESEIRKVCMNAQKALDDRNNMQYRHLSMYDDDNVKK